jgi:hypothetical protein
MSNDNNFSFLGGRYVGTPILNPNGLDTIACTSLACGEGEPSIP